MSGTPRQLQFFADGAWRDSSTSPFQRLLRSLHGRGHRPGAPVHQRRGGSGRGGRPASLSRLGGHSRGQPRPGPLPPEGPAGQAPGGAHPPGGPGARQGLERGHGGRPQGHGGGGVRLRHAAPDEGPRPHELHAGLRHHPVPRAPGRLRGHHPLELPGHDPHGLDGAPLPRRGQHHGAEGGRLDPPDLHADPGSLAGGGTAQGRSEPAHLRPRGIGASGAAPSGEGHLLRGLHRRGQPRLRHRAPPTASGSRPSRRPRTMPWC